MMTLEEAIKHCKDVSLSCTNKECALEHFQLLKWLQEYSNMLEEQRKQKSTDNIELKFHPGDWIIRNTEGFKHNTYLVKEIRDYYICEDLKGRRGTFTFNDVHNNFKLWDISDAIITPATKEQRDTLFAKMKEAGYEWDTTKKELKKVNYKKNYQNK